MTHLEGLADWSGIHPITAIRITRFTSLAKRADIENKGSETAKMLQRDLNEIRRSWFFQKKLIRELAEESWADVGHYCKETRERQQLEAFYQTHLLLRLFQMVDPTREYFSREQDLLAELLSDLCDEQPPDEWVFEARATIAEAVPGSREAALAVEWMQTNENHAPPYMRL